MPEPIDEQQTNGDTIQAQPATGQPSPSEEDQLAIGQPQGDTTAQPATDANAQVDEPMIPKSRLDEVSQKAVDAEARAAQLEQQMAIMAASQQQGQYAQQQQQQPAPQPEDPYADYADYDYVPIEAARETHRALENRVSQQIAVVQEQVFQVMHPGFDDLVGKQNPITGQFEMSSHLTNVLTKNPLATKALQNLPTQQAMKEMAYTLAKQEAEKTAASQQQQTNQAAADQQMYVDNTVSARTGPAPASSVGGDGGVNAQANIGSMTDHQFDAHERRVMAGDFD